MQRFSVFSVDCFTSCLLCGHLINYNTNFQEIKQVAGCRFLILKVWTSYHKDEKEQKTLAHLITKPKIIQLFMQHSRSATCHMGCLICSNQSDTTTLTSFIIILPSSTNDNYGSQGVNKMWFNGCNSSTDYTFVCVCVCVYIYIYIYYICI
jgi:hypothetical protein